MSGIAPVAWKDFEKFLLSVGCKYTRQKGDHRIYWRSDLKRPVILPTYKNIPVFIIRNNLRTLNISPEEYLDILKEI